MEKSNEILLKEASEVFDKTGLLPSQLLEQRDKMREALSNLLNGINPEDVCRGKFKNFFAEGAQEYKIAEQKAYVGSKEIPKDEQIVFAIETLKTTQNETH